MNRSGFLVQCNRSSGSIMFRCVLLFLLLCGFAIPRHAWADHPDPLIADSPNADSSNATRPNIVFAFADDWGRQASIYRGIGDADSRALCDLVDTPHFDSVARRGVLFSRAYVNAPSCTPCRSSLMSGQHFFRTGRAAILQGAIWDSSIPTWPRLLRQSGYKAGFTHKVWSPGSVADAPYGDAEHRFRPAGGIDSRFSQFATQQIKQGKSFADAKAMVQQTVRKNFQAFLQQQPSAEPFCYFYGPTNVHRKWIWKSGTDLWGMDPDDLKGRMPAFLPDVPTVRQDLVDYLGEVQAFDAALGVLLDELKSRGLLENTLVVVSGDHGPAGFPHGKCNLYEFG
ncbi:MAG: sulfatase-like hydrolase/transferase, partial [Planctomycetota bacterium]